MIFIFIFFPKISNAQTYNCSNEQAQAIIDYLKEGHIDPYSGTAGSPSGWEVTLDAMESGELASKINSLFPNSILNTWDNTIIYPIRSTNSSTRYLRLCFLVSTYDPNKIFLSSSYNANGYYQNTIGMSGSGTVYLGRILFSQNGFVSSDFQQYQNTSIQQYRPFETAIIEDRKVINFDYFLTLNSPKSVMIYSSLSGDNGYYQLGDPYYQFNTDGSVTKLQDNFEITEGTGSLQYIFDSGNSPDYININNYGAKKLSSRIWVGNDLSMFNHYYYYNSSGEEVSADDLIFFDTIEVDNQTYYIPYTSWVNNSFYYPNTIYQRLSFGYQSGDTFYGKQVLDDFEVIKWTSGDVIISTSSTSTGNYYNPSGDLIGSFSGENGVEDVNITSISDDISGDINDMLLTISGDLSNSEIFLALETAEQGFLDLFKSRPGDFVISWNDVIVKGRKMISAGSINFNAYCREVPILNQIKTYLNIILSAFFSFAIIRQVYNLFLGALGIDDPNLYENSSSEHLESQSNTMASVRTPYFIFTAPSAIKARRRAFRHLGHIQANIYRKERRRRDS